MPKKIDNALTITHPQRKHILIPNATPLGRINLYATRRYLPRSIIRHFDIKSLLRQSVSLLSRHAALIETIFLHFEELGFGDVDEGDNLAGYGGPDC